MEQIEKSQAALEKKRKKKLRRLVSRVLDKYLMDKGAQRAIAAHNPIYDKVYADAMLAMDGGATPYEN